MRKKVAIIGTLDTKESEALFLKNGIESRGPMSLLIDVSCTKTRISAKPDVPRDEVANAAHSTIEEVARMERGAASKIMAAGLTQILTTLSREGEIHGVIGYGGSSGVSIIAPAMESLPMGFPKMILTTIARDASTFLGIKDITVMPSISDLAGGKLNRIEVRVLSNAMNAIIGMVEGRSPRTRSNPTILITQMGVTTPFVMKAKLLLDSKGYETVAFHAIGTGGRTVESLIQSGYAEGILDITLAEISNELLGGICSAGPERLTAAGRVGIPQVIAPGALEMVNFLGPGTQNIPRRFKNRLFYFHNRVVTLMRITAEEAARLGEILAEKMNLAKGPTVMIIPLKGWSTYDSDMRYKTIDFSGKPTGIAWHDSAVHEAFVSALEKHLDTAKPNIILKKVNYRINDPGFARLACEMISRMVAARRRRVMS